MKRSLEACCAEARRQWMSHGAAFLFIHSSDLGNVEQLCLLIYIFLTHPTKVSFSSNPYHVVKSTQAIRYYSVHTGFKLTLLSSMDTAPLICLHISARQLAQAAVWTGDKWVMISLWNVYRASQQTHLQILVGWPRSAPRVRARINRLVRKVTKKVYTVQLSCLVQLYITGIMVLLVESDGCLSIHHHHAHFVQTVSTCPVCCISSENESEYLMSQIKTWLAHSLWVNSRALRLSLATDDRLLTTASSFASVPHEWPQVTGATTGGGLGGG